MSAADILCSAVGGPYTNMGDVMKARVLLACAAMSVAAIGFAGTAVADPANGAYRGTVTDVTDPGHGLTVGTQLSFFLNSCGPDCTKMTAKNIDSDLQRSGDVWSGSNTTPDGSTCGLSLSNDARTLTLDCPGAMVAHYSVTKVG
ncbi:hypothetical protein MINS_15810 [Mycolicibacterium insubricum]|nr:hypothetical protein MINS_15810 [Mycolicibacterium insubricum]